MLFVLTKPTTSCIIQRKKGEDNMASAKQIAWRNITNYPKQVNIKDVNWK